MILASLKYVLVMMSTFGPIVTQFETEEACHVTAREILETWGSPVIAPKYTCTRVDGDGKKEEKS